MRDCLPSVWREVDGAPALLLLHGPYKGVDARDNCIIAATNVVNYAHSMGLGTCFVGFVTMGVRYNSNLRQLLGIRKGHRVFVCVVMGYPAISHVLTVSRKQPKVNWMEQVSLARVSGGG